MGGGYLYNQNKNHKGLEIVPFRGFCFGKKGFTLIEIIAIIILLSVIALITYPIINNLISDSREELYNKQISELERLSNTWVTKNINKLKIEDGYTYNLSFEELHEQGFVSDEQVKNPKTGKNLEGCIKVVYNSSNNGYNVNYDSTCTTMGEIKEPTITLRVEDGIINDGFATSDFDVKVVGSNITSYTHCTSTSECEPSIKVNSSSGNITINQEGTIFVCVIGTNDLKSTSKICNSYKLDKTELVMG